MSLVNSSCSDGIDVVRTLGRSKFPKKSGFNERIDLLQRAEENYYQDEASDKQVHFK